MYSPAPDIFIQALKRDPGKKEKEKNVSNKQLYKTWKIHKDIANYGYKSDVNASRGDY